MVPAELLAEAEVHKSSEIEELKALIIQQQDAFNKQRLQQQETLNKQRQIIDGQGQQIQKLISQVKELSNIKTSETSTALPENEQAATAPREKQEKSATVTDVPVVIPVAKSPVSPEPKADKETITSAQNQATKKPPQPIKPVGKNLPNLKWKDRQRYLGLVIL